MYASDATSLCNKVYISIAQSAKMEEDCKHCKILIASYRPASEYDIFQRLGCKGDIRVVPYETLDRTIMQTKPDHIIICMDKEKLGDACVSVLKAHEAITAISSEGSYHPVIYAHSDMSLANTKSVLRVRPLEGRTLEEVARSFFTSVRCPVVTGELTGSCTKTDSDPSPAGQVPYSPQP